MGEQRIVTKAAFDTSGVVEGANAGKLALVSYGETGAQVARRQKEEAETAGRAYRRLVESVDPAAKAQGRYERAVETVNRAVAAGRVGQEEANRTLQRAEQHYNRAAGVTGALTSAVSGLVRSYIGLRVIGEVKDFLGGAVREYREHERAIRQVNAAIGSTGGLAGVTAPQLDALASSMGRLTNFEDDVVLSAEAILLTFTRVNGDIFPDAIRLAADLSERFGTDLNSAVVQVGKALQDPIKGVTALARSGVSFTAQQKEQIKTLVETGRIYEAQRIILSELKTEVGGAAQAGQDGFTRLDHVVKDLQQSFGAGLVPALDDTISRLTETATNQGAITYFHNLGAAVGETTSFLVGLILKFEEWQQKKLNERGAGVAGAYGLQTTRAEDAGIEAAYRQAAQHWAPAIAAANAAAAVGAKKQREELDRAALAAAEQEKAQKLSAGHEERISKAIHGQRDHVSRLREQWALVQAGMDPSKAQRLFDIAQKLGLSLQSGAVKAMAELVAKATEYEDRLRGAALLGRYTPGGPSFQPLPRVGGPPEPVGGGALEIAQRLAEMERVLAEARQRAADALRSDLMTAEERRIQVLAQGKVLLDAGLISLETWNRLMVASNNAVDEGVSKQERALGTQLDNWSSFLGALADEFGGFFSYLAQAVQALQSARGLGDSVSNAISGGSGGMAAGGGAGAAGSVVAVAAIFYEVYKAVSAHIKSQRLQRYGSAAEFNLVGGDEGTTTLNREAFKVVNAIRDAIRNFENALRISVTDLEKIGIRVRNDGKYVAAYVNGLMIGHFDSVNEAIQAAFMTAVMTGKAKLAGLSDLMVEGMKGWTSPDADEFMSFMQSLREISDLSLSPGTVQLQETVRHLDQLWEVLGRVASGSDAATQAALDLAAAEVDAWAARYRAVTGTEETPEEQLARMNREADLLDKQKEMRIAELRLRAIDLRVEADLLRARGAIVRGNGEIARGDIEIGRDYLRARGKLVEGEVNLYQAQLDALEATIEAITGLIIELERIPNAVGNVHLPRPNAGGGGGPAGPSLRDLIDQSNADAALNGLSDYGRKVEEIMRKWREAIEGANLPDNAEEKARRERDRAIKAANGNAEAIKKANDAYERAIRNIQRTRQEIDEATEARRRELEALKAENQADVRGRYDEATSRTPEIDSVRARYDQLEKDVIEASYGAEELAAKLAGLAAAEQRALQQMEFAIGDQLLGELKEVPEWAARANELARMELEAKYEGLRLQLVALGAWERWADVWDASYKHALDAIGKTEDETDKSSRNMRRTSDDASRTAASLQDALGRLKEFTDGLLLDQQLTTLSPEKQVEEARRQLELAIAGARTGDPAAIARLQEIERQVLDVFKRAFGMGDKNRDGKSEYQEIFDRILGVNAELQSSLGDDVGTAARRAIGHFGTVAEDAIARTATMAEFHTASVADAGTTAIEVISSVIGAAGDEWILAARRVLTIAGNDNAQEITHLDELLSQLPQYADGGYIAKRQLAILHPREVVIPIDRSPAFRMLQQGGGDNREVVRAIRESAGRRNDETAEVCRRLEAVEKRLDGLKRVEDALLRRDRMDEVRRQGRKAG